MKGQIAMIEAVIAIVALFIAFNMMISVEEYQTKWKESTNLLQGRDILITADRTGKLHDYAFSSAFSTEFLSKINSIKDSIVKNEMQGTLGNTIYVACKCTSEKVAYLQNVLNDLKFNTRKITAVVCSTEFTPISTCGSSKEYPDVLVIWEYNSLTDYINVLTDFVNKGNGLIEIVDVQNNRVDGIGDDDEGQKRIFGLKSIDEGNFPQGPDEFLKSRNVSQLPYQSYKWFYHSPYLLTGIVSESVPVENGIPPCASGMRGEFKFQDSNHRFWICGTTSVYWDTNGNNKADMVVTPRNKFSLDTHDFLLNYIDSTDKMRISFKPDYKFNDFVAAGNANNKLAPTDSNKNKVLLSLGFWDPQKEKPISAIILNGTGSGKTAWIADFARGGNGLADSGDDHKQLLSSMVLSLTNKNSKGNSQIGQTTSYINVNNTDILEIYRINLNIGKPF